MVSFSTCSKLFIPNIDIDISQVCSNGTRVFVHESIADKFLSLLIERVSQMKIGDPFLPETTVGATISEEQFNKVVGYIDIAKKEVAFSFIP